MSRSYKKHPVCSSHESKKEAKQEYNRRFRRKLNRGEYDDMSMIKGNFNRRLQNFTWVYDTYTSYWNESIDYKWYMRNGFTKEEFNRWYVRK